MADEQWKPDPRTAYMFEPLTEMDQDAPPNGDTWPNRGDYEVATRVEPGLPRDKIHAGLFVTVSVNRRTLDRNHLDKLFEVSVVTATSALLIEYDINSGCDRGLAYMCSFAEYEFYDGSSFSAAINGFIKPARFE